MHVCNSGRPPCIRLACQTITWGEERVQKREESVRAVADAGYEGVEIGARFLDLDAAEPFRAFLDACGIRLTALHCGWNPFLDRAKKAPHDDLDALLRFAQTTATPYLVMSGNAAQQREDIAAMKGLNEVAAECRKAGVTLCYHNHWWEIEDNARILREILDRTDPELVAVCPDVGWIRKITADVVAVLELMAPRIRMVHFKDYTAAGVPPMDNETEFGEGIMDFPTVFDWLGRLALNELWVVAEQWKSSVRHLPPGASIRRNISFLRKVMRRMHHG
ncbi:MAG: sugar phosphate isomerase/epimerase [Kiritimatiellaeota bacterium]|nr:sugar phosphate isomerase/epimerase [Kiritimatiellota bacterium]